MRCTMRGVKPAIDASVRRASSSAVLREFTIQSLSAYDEKGAGLAGEATPEPPRHRPQLVGGHVTSQGDRRQVVVVDQRQVDVVASEEVDGLERLVLAEPHLDAGVARAELGHHGQQGAPDRGGEARDPDDAAGLVVRVEVAAGGVHGREDGHGVLGEPASGRSEAYAPALRLHQRYADLAGEGGDVLGHARGGRAELFGDLSHRPEARELQEDAEAVGLHTSSVHDC